jgi:hypothetical protein
MLKTHQTPKTLPKAKQIPTRQTKNKHQNLNTFNKQNI